MAFTSRNAQRNTLFVSTGMIVVLLTLFGAFRGTSFQCIPPDAELIKKRGLDRPGGVYVGETCNYLIGSGNLAKHKTMKTQSIEPVITRKDGLGHRVSSDAKIFCCKDKSPNCLDRASESCLRDFRIFLRKDPRDAFVDSANDFLAECGGKPLILNFGGRTNKRQNAAWEKRHDDDWLKAFLKWLEDLGPAAPAGMSNHEDYDAIDISSSQLKCARPILERHGFRWYGPGDPPHFDWPGS